MSQDILVSTIEAVRVVPEAHLGLIKDYAHKLSGNRQAKWAREGTLFLRQEPTWRDPLAELGNIVILEVNYNLTLEQMVATGQYNWSNGNITAENFPLTGKGIMRFEARYFHFDRDISSENADKAIGEEESENPWMSAAIEHICAHGAKFPDEQRKFPIVGLGSSTQVCGSRDVPSLYGDASKRELNLAWWDDDWSRFYRFLAVRKLSVTSVT